MIPMEEIRKKSSEFLRKLYELSEGNVMNWFHIYKVGEQLGFDKDLTNKVADYLKSKGKIKYQTMHPDPKLGPTIGITLVGIEQVEKDLK